MNGIAANGWDGGGFNESPQHFNLEMRWSGGDEAATAGPSSRTSPAPTPPRSKPLCLPDRIAAKADPRNLAE
jgi:hypothetical protein